MFTGTAELYDLLDCKFSDYKTQAFRLDRCIREHRPGATSLLLIPCGSGELARQLANAYDYQVSGIDDRPGLVQRAANKNPDGLFQCSDLSGFKMSKKYDVVVLLQRMFGSLENIAQLFDVISAAARQLNSGGVLLLEPWQPPQEWRRGHMQMETLDEADLSITRISYYEHSGNISHIHHEYMVLSSQGMLESTEIRELYHFSPDDLVTCFEQARLQLESVSGDAQKNGYLVARQDKKVYVIETHRMERQAEFVGSV